MPKPRKLSVLFYDYVPNLLERRAPHRDGHLELIGDFERDGRLLLAGATGDPPKAGLLVFADAAAAEQFVAADPYGAAGLVTSHRIEPWTVVADAVLGSA